LKPCVLIPIYDHGATLGAVVDEVASLGLPALIVDDGSHDETRRAIERVRARHAFVSVLRHERNRGRGAALQTGYREAARRGFSHALQLDADAQHDVADAKRFLAAAERDPTALILGARDFPAEAPRSRRWGRWVSIVWVWIETGSRAVRDPLCGYRCMPLAATLAVLDRVACGSHMEFDPEIIVRLVWSGVPVVNVPTHVRYHADGVSHFDLLRDNLRMIATHTRLVLALLTRRQGGRRESADAQRATGERSS
jgi:glycosyltransferase involved in cell wall biosynthesis